MHTYRVCHRFRITKWNNFLKSILITLELKVIFEAARAAVKICSSVTPNHHEQIKLVKIHETHALHILN